MGEAVGDQGFDAFGRVARQRIAHLDGRRQFACALFQYIGEVLARMLPSGKEQRDGILLLMLDFGCFMAFPAAVRLFNSTALTSMRSH